MQGKKDTADGAEKRRLFVCGKQLFAPWFGKKYNRSHQGNGPQKPVGGSYDGWRLGIPDKNCRKGNSHNADDNHNHRMLF